MTKHIEPTPFAQSDERFSRLCALEYLSTQDRHLLLMVLALYCKTHESKFLNIDFDHNETYVRFHFDGTGKLTPHELQKALKGIYFTSEDSLTPFSTEHLLIAMSQLADMIKVSYSDNTTTIQSSLLQQHIKAGSLCRVETYSTVSHGTNIVLKLANGHRLDIDPIVADLAMIFRGSDIALTVNGTRLYGEHSKSRHSTTPFAYGSYSLPDKAVDIFSGVAIYLDGIPVRAKGNRNKKTDFFVHLDSSLFERDPLIPDRLVGEDRSLSLINSEIAKIWRSWIKAKQETVPTNMFLELYSDACMVATPDLLNDSPLPPRHWETINDPSDIKGMPFNSWSRTPGDKLLLPGANVLLMPTTGVGARDQDPLAWCYARASGLPVLSRNMHKEHWVYKHGHELSEVTITTLADPHCAGAIGTCTTPGFNLSVLFCESVTLMPDNPSLPIAHSHDIPIYSHCKKTLFITPRSLPWLDNILLLIAKLQGSLSGPLILPSQRQALTLRIITAALDYFGHAKSIEKVE